MLKKVRCFSFLLLGAVLFAQEQANHSQRIPSAFAEQLRAVKKEIPAGKVTKTEIRDPLYNKSRTLWIYTPESYSSAKPGGYDLLLCFDGESYSSDDGMALPTVLDNLIADKKVRPTVALMLDNGMRAERLADLANRADFTKFVGEVLIPWARKNYNLSSDPKRSTITGYSAGGLAAANIAFFYPNLFGNVLAQSPALWRGAEASNDPPYEWLATQVKAAPVKPVRFYIEMGALESIHTLGGRGPNALEAARRFRDVLAAKGYSVRYMEVPNASHEMGHWRDEVVEGLLYFEEQ